MFVDIDNLTGVIAGDHLHFDIQILQTPGQFPHPANMQSGTPPEPEHRSSPVTSQCGHGQRSIEPVVNPIEITANLFTQCCGVLDLVPRLE